MAGPRLVIAGLSAWWHGAEREDRMRRILYENGLSLTMLGLFVLCVVGQSVAGHGTYNAERPTTDNVP